MNYIKINSVEHLKELIESGHEDYVRVFGSLRSSKHITMSDDGNGIEVNNFIDDTIDSYSWGDLTQKDNYVANMIMRGHLFAEIL